MQRVRVGMTGLAMVLILIGLASAIFSSANREEPVAAIGAPNAEAVANMTVEGSGNLAAPKKEESLAELGVTPSTAATESVDAAAIAKRIQEQAEAEARQRAETRNQQ